PEPKPAARAARTSGEVHSTYKNRAMIWQSAAKQQRAEQPKISGNVYSGDGMSLAGATILATTFDRAGNTPSTLGTVKSDEQGHFEIPLPDGTYQLNASLDGYGPTAATANAGDTVSLVLSKSGVLRGHVRDESGQPERIRRSSSVAERIGASGLRRSYDRWARNSSLRRSTSISASSLRCSSPSISTTRASSASRASRRA